MMLQKYERPCNVIDNFMQLAHRMTIAFVHNSKAFLPETLAYVDFFTRHGMQCEVVNTEEIHLVHRNMEWRLMGTDFTKPREGIVRIHEYTSTSLPPWRKWKNWSKSFFNAQPDYRLFLNEYVKETFFFRDNVPFGFRDMGVPVTWTAIGNGHDKKFDFVYLGDTGAFREPELLLNLFSTGPLSDRTLMVITTRNEKLQNFYRAYNNIFFTGPVAHSDVAPLLKQARFGINFIVDKEPINRQTSTKFLEYAACGLPVVTTDYYWVRNFQKQFGGNYYYLAKDLSNVQWDAINNFDYRQPDLSDWTWEHQIRSCGVLPFLEQAFPGLQFPDKPKSG